jgi:biotin carboxyl carrier protein
VEPILSPCSGTVERIITKEENHVHEWEKLLLIKDSKGKIIDVSIGISGVITSLNVSEGQEVNPQTVLAILQADLYGFGSD